MSWSSIAVVAACRRTGDSMINRRRKNLNETSFRRRYTDRQEWGTSSLGARVFAPIHAPTDMKVPPWDPAPSSYEPPDHGGKFGGAGASGSWESTPSAPDTSTPDFSNVDSGSSSTSD